MLDPPLPRLLLLLLATVAAATVAVVAAAASDIRDARPERRLNVLAGGHLRILNEDPNDTELLTASASGSKDKKRKKGGGGGDEDRKTLSQQVADGRYGLIQRELFGVPQKKPGVLSYDGNAEVPADNADNLGGLHKNEIWLAENHLLVVRGGVYPQHDDRGGGGGGGGGVDDGAAAHLWPAIDDYKAPKRPVKLPAHPKVPPPFPVQLTDDGPLQILGTNSSRTLNGSLEQAGYPVPPAEGYVPGTGPFFPPLYPYPPNATAGQAPFPGAPFAEGPGEPQAGAPFPPITSLNGTLPPYFASLPPGAVILPPPNNLSDAIDEDDPSIYYPPPYSFYYPKDNATNIRPGPLVPGIILPPPPDFFAPLDETTTRPTVPVRRPTPRYKVKTTTKPVKQIRPTTTPVPSTSVLDNKPTRRPTKILPVQTPSEINNELKPFITTLRPVQVTTLRPVPVQKIVTVLPVRPVPKARPRPTVVHRHRKPQPGVTILKPVVTRPTVKPPVTLKLTSRPVSIDGTPHPEIYIFNNEVTGKPFAVYGPPQKPKTTTTTTTQLPIKVYYTTSNEIESNSVTELPIKFQSQDAISINKVVNPQPNYYYYDEKRRPNGAGATQQTPQTIQELQDALYQLPRDFYIPGKRVVPQRQKSRYLYGNQRPYTQKPRIEFLQQTSSRPDSFKLHIARLQKQLQYFTTQKPSYGPVYSPRPVYQYSFEAANYQPQQNQGPVYSYQQQPQPQNQYYQQRPQFQQHRDFRTPQPFADDAPQDKFRPMPHYSVQIQAAVDLTPTEKPQQTAYNNPAPQNYYQGGNSEKPAPTRYYNNRKPEYDYDEIPQRQQYKQQANQQQNPTTPRGTYSVTPNPIYQGFYTKPDEGYFDDQTKTYFTIFGKKIPNATTPIPPREYTTPAPMQNQPQPQQQHQQQQISLAGDTLVNYLHPRPEINPDAEYIQVNPNRNRSNYPRVVKFSSNRQQNAQKQQAQQQYVQQTVQNQQPESQYVSQTGNSNNNNNNNNPEIIKAIPIRVPEGDDQSGSFISYELPGDDGAHFYFLTPQLAQRRDQGARYFYSQPDGNANRVRRYDRQTGETVRRRRRSAEAVDR